MFEARPSRTSAISGRLLSCATLTAIALLGSSAWADEIGVQYAPAALRHLYAPERAEDFLTAFDGKLYAPERARLERAFLEAKGPERADHALDVAQFLISRAMLPEASSYIDLAADREGLKPVSLERRVVAYRAMIEILSARDVPAERTEIDPASMGSPMWLVAAKLHAGEPGDSRGDPGCVSFRHRSKPGGQIRPAAAHLRGGYCYR